MAGEEQRGWDVQIWVCSFDPTKQHRCSNTDSKVTTSRRCCTSKTQLPLANKKVYLTVSHRPRFPLQLTVPRLPLSHATLLRQLPCRRQGLERSPSVATRRMREGGHPAISNLQQRCPKVEFTKTTCSDRFRPLHCSFCWSWTRLRGSYDTSNDTAEAVVSSVSSVNRLCAEPSTQESVVAPGTTQSCREEL